MTAPPTGGGDTGGIGGAIGNAVGGAVAGTAGVLLGPIITAVQTWVDSIESGFAHTLDVILNNVWYGAIAVSAGVTFMIGVYVIWQSSPMGKAATKAAESVAAVAL